METSKTKLCKHFKLGRLHFYNGAKGSYAIAFGLDRAVLRRIFWHFWIEVIRDE